MSKQLTELRRYAGLTKTFYCVCMPQINGIYSMIIQLDAIYNIVLNSVWYVGNNTAHTSDFILDGAKSDIITVYTIKNTYVNQWMRVNVTLS